MSNVKRLIWYQPGLNFAGGGERLLLEGLKYFREHGIEAVLFVEDKLILKEALFDGKYNPTVLQFEIKNKTRTVIASKNIIHKIYYGALIIRTLLKFNPDIIIANAQPIAKKIWILSMVHFWKKISYVCFIHGSFFQFSEDQEKYAWIFRKNFTTILNGDSVYKELISPFPKSQPFWVRISLEIESFMSYLAVRKARTIFVPTQKAKKEIELLYGHHNVCVFHGAFSQELLNSHFPKIKKMVLGIENKFVFLSLCRLVDKKRVHIIIQAFSMFVQNNPNSILLIGGTGPKREDLERLTNELNIVDKVRFLGFIHENELIDYYNCSDVFVSADNADYDITSIVALALGKRVVASTQHEFDPDFLKLKLLFPAKPTPQGFLQSFIQALETPIINVPTIHEEVLKEYSWERYFEHITLELEKNILA